MKHPNRCRTLAVALALSISIGIPLRGASAPSPPPIDPSGDDLFLLTASTAPNVILLMDNSASMNQIEWHPAFDPNADPASYGCSYFDNSRVYRDDELDDSLAICGHTRTIYAPANPTLWDGRYLNWYYGLPDGSPILNEIDTAIANVAGCTQAGSAKFFDEKYRRTRFEASKQVLLDLLCVAESKNVRFGLASLREAADAGGVDPNGGYVMADLGRSNPNHAAELEAAIKNNTVADEGAPLSEALFQIYTFWMTRDTTEQLPKGADNSTRFPRYQYDKFGNWDSNQNNWTEDPMAFECEKAFVVIVTDGVPSRDTFDQDPGSTAQGFDDFVDLIGDYHDEGADGVPDAEVPGDAVETSWYLDDIAKYMHDNDFRRDLGGDQTVDTYTVGLATDQTTDDFLGMTAEVGNGLFFHVQDGDELAYALISALNDIIEKAASFTAAAVPSARTVDGGDFYQSYFFPSGKSAFWEGHIRAWRITADGDIVDANGNCALDDPDAGECNSGPFKPEADFFWDAAEEVPDPGARNLYVSKRVAGASTRVGFDDSLTAGDLDVPPFVDDSVYPPVLPPELALYPVMGSTARTNEGLADEIVAYVRGCFFGTGVTDPTLVASPQACLSRPARLGDIFHSNPVVVRHPNSTFAGESYYNFKQAYAGRDRVIYSGTNAGFLEAVHAGDWQAAATPPSYDAGSGAELFGFMPWWVRQTIKHLPVDSPSDRTHYVDGSPQVSDVWIHPDALATAKNPDGREWRTMLVGGLRRGGREYYALDITNPSGIVGPGGVQLEYPGFQANGPAYGWEFPAETDPDGWLPFMGFTWGQPIITRVRVSVDDDGIPHERWVAVVTGGYDENGDPNPQPVTGRLSVYNSAKTQGRAIFLIDMKTGGVLARKKLDVLATDGQPVMRYAMPSTPAVLDLNNDGFADVIYVGNLGGQVFKWVVTDLGGDPINGTAPGDDANQPQWKFRPFFLGPIANDSGTLYYQNFYTPPAAALYDGKLWLAFGAGERKDLAYTGNAGLDENNRFYVVNDPDPLERAAVGLPLVQEADLVDATSFPGGVSLTTERGFFVKADEGEKFVTGTVIFGGLVVTASFTPTPSADPCAARGEGKAYIFDLLTGEGYFRDASNNPERTISIGVGLPTDPKVSVGVGGKNNRVYIEKSGADLESIGAQNIQAGGQILYWREQP